MIEAKDCIFNTIHLFDQPIDRSSLDTLLYIIYNNIYFSTFPYLLYKEDDSLLSIKKYSSSNCIGIAMFIKMYLLNNYKLKSYIIPATVSSQNKLEGTPNMCHCALLLPISTTEFYILDCALYFIEPMYCSIYNNIERVIKSSDIYNYQNHDIHYKIKQCENRIIDKQFNQTIPVNSLCVNCYQDDNINDDWNYYLVEIINPDNNIGYSFLLNKPNPFILITELDNNIVKLKYKIEIKDEEFNIKQYPEREIIYNGNTYDNNDILYDIKNKYRKYFADYII